MGPFGPTLEPFGVILEPFGAIWSPFGSHFGGILSSVETPLTSLGPGYPLGIDTSSFFASAMPALVLFNRKWLAGSDDFVVLPLIGVSIRLFWAVLLLVFHSTLGPHTGKACSSCYPPPRHEVANSQFPDFEGPVAPGWGPVDPGWGLLICLGAC